MRGEWKRFLQSLPLEVVFHHKDDFAEAYPGHDVALPAILVHSEDTPMRVLVPAADLNLMADVEELMGVVEERLVTEVARTPQLRIVA